MGRKMVIVSSLVTGGPFSPEVFGEPHMVTIKGGENEEAIEYQKREEKTLPRPRSAHTEGVESFIMRGR